MYVFWSNHRILFECTVYVSNHCGTYHMFTTAMVYYVSTQHMTNIVIYSLNRGKKNMHVKYHKV